MSYLSVTPKFILNRKGSRRAQNVQRFTESLGALKHIGGVLKAKNLFLKAIRETDVPEDNLDDLVTEEWNKIVRGSISLIIGDYDFSELEKFDVSDPVCPQPQTPVPLSRGPPPPPPPMAPGPPPPPPPPVPNGTTTSPALGFSNQKKTILTNLAVPKTRMSKLHWTPLSNLNNVDTVWASLPEIEADFDDFLDLFMNNPGSRTSHPSPSSPIEEKRALDLAKLKDIEIIMRGFPKEEAELMKSLQDMDDSKITRDQVDQILKLLRQGENITAVENFKSSNPDVELNKAERFLLLLGTLPRLKEKLIFWRFKQDCEASEEDICEELKHLTTMIDSVKSNKYIKIFLGAALKAGNFLNSSEARGFSILDDLQKLSYMKDRHREKTVLYYVVHKILDVTPGFALNNETLLSNLASVSNTDYDGVKKDLETMKNECSSSLKFILSEGKSNKGNAEMCKFMKIVMERVEAITKIEALVKQKYRQFLDWLGVDRGHTPSEVAKVFLGLCNDVNSVLEEIKKEKEEIKRKESIIAMQRPATIPRVKKHSVVGKNEEGPNIMSELQQKLNRRHTTDNFPVDDIDNRFGSYRDKEEDDENEEFLKVLRNDFQNRRLGLGVRRKGQRLP